jgi:hypothetical protein
MTTRLQIGVHSPLAEAPAFKARLDRCAAELADDLRIDEPHVTFHETSADRRHIVIAGHARPVAAQRRSQSAPDPTLADADAAAAALFRHRWLLIEPALAEWGVPSRPALRQTAEAGLTLPELVELHDAEASEDALLWRAAELHPPAVSLMHGAVDLPPDQHSAAARNGAEMAADLLGFEVPLPVLSADEGLEPTRFRLRLRKVRGPIEPDPIDGNAATAGRAVRAAYMRVGPQLLDAKVLLSRLLDPEAVPPDFARQALKRTPTILRVVEAVRPLLSEGFLLVDAVLLCEAILAAERSAGPGGARGDGRLLVLPGPLKPAGGLARGEDALSAYIRTALVAASLRVRADSSGERTKISALVLAPTTLAVLRRSEALDPGWENRLADRIFAIATDEDVLLVPEDVSRATRSLLADRIAGLPVIGPQECPDGVGLIQRHKAIVVTPETPR